MDYTRRVETRLDHGAALEATKEALLEQGFGVLTEIDIRATLKAKLGVDVEPQVILGACNPPLAHRALGVDPRVAALLPCNVVVRVEDGRTVVGALDPEIMATVSGVPELSPIADEASARIQAALEAVSTR